MGGWVRGVREQSYFFKNLRNLFSRSTHKWFISRNLFSRFRGKFAKINSAKIYSAKISSVKVNIENFDNRKVLAKFRSSYHFLEIEQDRHQKIPRTERFCKLCSTDILETEKHFFRM